MNVGDLAPLFTLDDQNGHATALADLLETGPVVLFFYPAAMTTGCTRESCHFRDLGSEFRALNAQRVGISMDAVDRQHRFATQESLDYPLLSDADGAVARLYGVKRPLNLLKVRRTTFVIAPDRRVREIIASETNMNAHADGALAALRALIS